MAGNELTESYVEQWEERRENGASDLQNASFERATSDLPASIGSAMGIKWHKNGW